MINCRGCGEPFMPRSPRQGLCKPGCGYIRPKQNRTRYPATGVKFIGVDGEGVTHPDGSHDYVLLSVGDQSLKASGDARLTLHEIFPFLYRQFVMEPNAVYVGFYLTYDFAHWFRGLPEERARMLFTDAGRAARKPKSDKNPTPYPVRYAGWEFDLLGLRRFKLRPDNNSQAPWMFICDSGPFWQCSFISAINPASWPEPIVTDSEFADIVAGKQHRATASLDATMVRYNVTENRVLGRAMGRLNEGFRAQDWQLRKSQWFGPGQAADAWMKSIDAPTREAIRDATPEPVLQSAQASYYGGWFEIPRHGIVSGESYEYDINSAYPHIISSLPCLLHGRWVQNDSHANSSPYQLVYITTQGSNPYLGGLPHRNEDGIISRPHNVTGWYWRNEVEAACRAGLIDAYGVYESWTYMPCDCLPPFRSIADLYNQRLAIGKNTPHGKALKLVYNSSYGKTAQSIGAPKYACSLYASLITSGCRSMIMDAISTHPNGARDVLMVATDGVYFRTPHPNLDVSPDTLGSWDAGTKSNLTLFMPGVYWDDKARDALITDATMPLKSRGINGVELAKHITDIDLQFSVFGDREWEWPVAEIPVQFSVISPKLALARGKWETCGNIVTDGVKILSSDPSNKRDTKHTRFIDGLVTTTPYRDRGQNYGYAKRFGLSIEALIDNDVLVTDDGTINQELAELLGQK